MYVFASKDFRLLFMVGFSFGFGVHRGNAHRKGCGVAGHAQGNDAAGMQLWQRAAHPRDHQIRAICSIMMTINV